MKAKIEKFEDLDVWQNAVELSVNIYTKFTDCRDFSFKNQICRASVSVPSNIAEGYERLYNKEFVQFLFIAKGSTGELRTQLFIGYKLGFIKDDDYSILNEDSRKISAQLHQLIKIRKEKFN
jgi:four helix bundle protein